MTLLINHRERLSGSRNLFIFMSKIHFIITGGTIDSYYDGTKDTAVPRETSIIPDFIQSLKLYGGGF